MGDCAGRIVSPKPVKVTPSENTFPEDVIRLRWGHPGVGGPDVLIRRPCEDRGRGPVTTEDVGINAPTMQATPTAGGARRPIPWRLQKERGRVTPGFWTSVPRPGRGHFCCPPPGLFSPAAAPADSHSWCPTREARTETCHVQRDTWKQRRQSHRPGHQADRPPLKATVEARTHAPSWPPKDPALLTHLDPGLLSPTMGQ